MIKKISVLTALLVSFFAFTAQAYAYRIATGAWKGGSYNNKTTGAFSHCVVSAKYKRGDRLLLSINRKYVFSVGVADARWNLRQGSRYPVTMQVDRRAPINRTALAVSPNQLVITINDRVTFYRMVKAGRTLRIRANGLNRGYSLRGTSRALNAILRCVKRKNRYANVDAPRAPVDQPRAPVDQPRAPIDQPRAVDTPSGNDPFGTDEPRTANPTNTDAPTRVANLPPKQKPRVASGVSDQKALIFAVNILSEAGISGYKFLENNPFKSAGYQVAWQYSKGKRGALATYANRRKDFVDTQTSTILGSDAKNCKGKFVSGFRKSDASAKWAGRRLFTVCSGSTSGNDFTINYSIGLQPSGVATIIATHVGRDGLDENSGDESAQIDQAIYNSATFRKIGK